MYEELIQRLEKAAGGPEGIKMAHDAADAISALQAENAELQQIAEQEHNLYIETLGERDGFEARATVLGAVLARVEAERDAAIADIPHVCSTCGRFDDGACPILAHKDYPADCEGWEWHGAQGEG